MMFDMTVAALKPRNAVEPLRDIVQDLLVSELKSLQVSIDSLHTEIKLRDEKQSQAINHLSDKLDIAMNIRKRLVTVEARLPRN